MSSLGWIGAAGALILFTAPARAEGPEKVLEWKAFVSRDVVPAGSAAELAVVVKLLGDWHINAARPADPVLIPTQLSLEPVEGVSLGSPRYPKPHEQRFEFAEEPLLVYDGEVTIKASLLVDAATSPGKREIGGRLRYQACNNIRCLPPRNEAIRASLEIGGPDAESRPQHPDVFGAAGSEPGARGGTGERQGAQAAPSPAAASLPAAAAQEGPADPGAGGLLSPERVVRLFSTQGYLKAFGVIFLIGLALNLTPCVYPVIPITLGYFANQGEQRAGRSFVLAVIYVLGMAAMYSTLGVVAALSGQAFGSALGSPWVLGLEAAVMVALALSMFGLWEIGVPSAVLTRLSSSPAGLLGAGFMGLTVGVVAAPCLGPAILGLFVFVAQLGSVPMGFAIFFTLALGLGFPFLFLALASGNLRRLPRSGVWMVWIKHLFGFLLLAMALYFLRPLTGDPVFRWGIALVAVAAGGWLGFLDPAGRGQPGFRRLSRAAGVLLILAAPVAFRWLGPPPEPIEWRSYEPAAFESALKAGKPVLVDFTAEWCLPCKELERFTFSDEEVARAASRFSAFRADGTVSGDPRIESLQEKYAVKGYPTVLFIDSRGTELESLRVVGFVSAAEFRKRLERVD